jgi:hypothetical protein
MKKLMGPIEKGNGSTAVALLLVSNVDLDGRHEYR